MLEMNEIKYKNQVQKVTKETGESISSMEQDGVDWGETEQLDAPKLLQGDEFPD